MIWRMDGSWEVGGRGKDECEREWMDGLKNVWTGKRIDR